MLDEFVGRESELRLLRRLRERGQATLAVVYGRRRIGKTQLILSAYSGETIYSFEGLENQSSTDQLLYLNRQAGRYFPNWQPAADWYDLFVALSEQIGRRNCVLVLDEFQWLSNYRSKVISILKLVWDQELSRNNGLTLVLCGSVASFMVNKVVRSKAIYGRVDQVIHLKEFTLSETAGYLKRSPIEAIQAQLLVGGVPGYLKLLKGSDSVYLGMQQLAFEPHGYLTTEFERIFVSQFGKSGLYEQAIRALARHPQGLTRPELTKQQGVSDGGHLSNHLQDLETAGLITGYHPFNASVKARSRVYLVTDPYIRLYLSFIESSLPAIETGQSNLFINLTNTAKFITWLGLACEILCLRHSHQLAKLMGFADVKYKVGPYFESGLRNQKKGIQVDLVFDRKDAVLTVCEIRFRTQAPGLEVIDELEAKIPLLPIPGSYTLQKALITKQLPTKGVVSSAYFAHIVTLDQLTKP